MYEDKHRDYFSAERLTILDMLPSNVYRVLEVGCGAGNTLAMLKKKGACRQTVGIELFPEAAQQAAHKVDVLYCLDVEKSMFPSDLGRFDLILLLDILEHLVDPWSLLRELTNCHLSHDGKIIISLPNARHFSLVLPLLMGRFDYSERGIRDKTHLRFFARKNMLELIGSAGLIVEKTKRTSLDPGLNSGKFNIATLGLFSDFLTSQYIFCCAPADKS